MQNHLWMEEIFSSLWIHRVQTSLQQIVKQRMMKDSFKWTEVYPLNLLQILHSRSSKITNENEEHIDSDNAQVGQEI